MNVRRHSKALFAVAALLAFLVLPSSAFAGKSVERLITTGGTAGGVAVNTTSGDLYVQIVDGDRIERYASDGSFLGQFGSSGSGDGQFSFEGVFSQLAVDSSDGSVYVADPGNDRIEKFEADGTFVKAFGGSGSGDGQLSSPRAVAVDPTNGDVYVADTGNSRAQRFSSEGAFELAFGASFEGLFGPDTLADFAQVAVDSTGRVYAYSREGPSVGDLRIVRFKAGGDFDNFDSRGLSTGSIQQPQSLAIGPSNDHIYSNANLFPNPSGLGEFDEAGTLVDAHGIGAPRLVSVAVGLSGQPIYATDGETSRVFVLTDAGPTTPTVNAEPPTGVDAHRATIHGTVNPNGALASNWRFEYSLDGSSWTSTPGGQVLAGTSPVPVGETVEGLAANTEYRFRLSATPEFGDRAAHSGEMTFTTDAEAPLVDPLYAGVPTDTSAWLGAKINPQNAPTTFYIEYATDPGFANSVSVPVGKNGSAGGGDDLVLVNRLVTGLESSRVYHFRVVATNLAGTTTGESRSFETLAPEKPQHGLPDGRVWEKVSPSTKQGAAVFRGSFAWTLPQISARAQASSSGEAVAYASTGKFGGDSGPGNSQYVARRGPSGWVTEGINPFHEPGFDLGNINRYEWLSDDLSLGVASTTAALDPSDSPGTPDLYLRDPAGSYHYVSVRDSSTPKNAWFEARGASADGSHVVFEDVNVAGAVPTVLYEWTESGGVRNVGISPAGAPLSNAIGLGRGNNPGEAVGANAVSADGSHIFFTHRRDELYVREDGTTTTLVSASERTGDEPLVPHQGEFLGASTDGTIAFFAAGDALTDDSPDEPGLTHLYRWDSSSPLGERLSVLASVPFSPQTFLDGAVFVESGISDDGSSFYFSASADPAGEGTLGRSSQPGLYRWREGDGVRQIARLAAVENFRSPDEGLWNTQMFDLSQGPTGPYRPARVTHDGRFLAFASTESLTAYDTDHTSQIYLYDSEAEQLSCVSCSSFEAKSKNHSWFLSCIAEPRNSNGDVIGCEPLEYLPRNLREDGKRLVFDSKDALLPEDTNGATDVYEWSEGRLHLLSAGTSSSWSSLIDASADGDDVFFTTAQQLVPSDKDDLVDLYDARVGGRAEPNADIPCVADECQGTPTPSPGFETPGSAGFSGQGNAKAAKPRCRKGKVRRKNRCVNRKVRHRRSSKNNRRAGR